MAPYQANLSHDGYTYTKSDGLTKGLHTYSVIKPQRKIHEGSKDQLWEAIVIGSGYAGLVAARDLVKAGTNKSSRFCKRNLFSLRSTRQKDTAP